MQPPAGHVTKEVPGPEPRLVGIDHISLSVRDLSRSERWYCDVLGFHVVRRVEREGFRRSILRHESCPAVFGLTEHQMNAGAPAVDHETGLDHLAFRLESPEEVRRWRTRLDSLDISYSSPSDALLVIRDPDDIQVELAASP